MRPSRRREEHHRARLALLELLDLGVDGIMTDRPAALRDVLVDRGMWAAGPPLRS